MEVKCNSNCVCVPFDSGRHVGSGGTMGSVEVGERIPDGLITDFGARPYPRLRIERKWAMPNSYTFKIKVVEALLKEEMNVGVWCDPFAGMYSPAQVTNDLNPKARAMFHMDALAFLRAQPTAHYAGVLYDPPYSQRQVKECYDNIGINRWDGRMTPSSILLLASSQYS